MKFSIPEKVNYIIDKFMEHGYEAYAVGGCVRDMALGKEPMDWDITTSATPEEMKKIFRRTVDTGIEHGTLTVLLDDEGFEVTTYRLDGNYKNHRHPESVVFTSNLIEDLKRRDFTINAMAFNNSEGFVDEFSGSEDLENKIIRCVGDPRRRFDEDALRILRSLRFSAQLDFDIEEETLKAMIEKSELLRNISAERIRDELDKILSSDNPDRLFLAYELGITKIILPEFDKMMETKQNSVYHAYSVGVHTVKAIEAVANRKSKKAFSRENFTEKERRILRWTMLLHDIKKPDTLTTDDKGFDHFYGHQEEGVIEANKILRKLKFDNYTISHVVHLVKWHDYRFTLTPKAMRRAISKIGKDYMELLFEVQRADSNGKNPKLVDGMMVKIEEAEKLFSLICEKEQCVQLKDLEIKGRDLIDLGFEEGKMIGSTLNVILDKVIEKPELNNREELIKIAKTIMNQ